MNLYKLYLKTQISSHLHGFIHPLGPPVSSEVDIGTLHAKNPLDLWKKVFERVFPPEVLLAINKTSHTLILNIYLTPIFFVFQNTKERKELKDPAKDPQYNEPLIDSIRAQKDQVQTHVYCHLKITTTSRYLFSSNLQSCVFIIPAVKLSYVLYCTVNQSSRMIHALLYFRVLYGTESYPVPHTRCPSVASHLL